MGAHLHGELITPPEGLVSNVCWMLSRANWLQKAEIETALLSAGLTTRQHQVLTAALDGERTQTQLANILGLDKTTMMVALDELEREDLAERRSLPSDRRARIVAVTAEGRKLLRRADKAFVEANERVLSRLPEDERSVFLQALERLACPGCVESRETAGDSASPVLA
ncbi:MAG TPA: MarR family winged helix-turn-helix transcriptional regulator [Solirubrobacteraceae bacterium]|nr:MarR family winged helix-turn-helix transcriptional regulator [Solirubrobacteraceae bacterium]